MACGGTDWWGVSDMTPEQMMAWIDGASYEQLLRKWRHEPAGNPFFVGDVGLHFSQVMEQKKLLLGEAERVAVSKRVGWD